jgi:hypothetical protein
MTIVRLDEIRNLLKTLRAMPPADMKVYVNALGECLDEIELLRAIQVTGPRVKEEKPTNGWGWK